MRLKEVLVKGKFGDYNAGMMILVDQAYLRLVQKVCEQAKSSILVCQFKIDSAGISGSGAVHQLLVTLVNRAVAGVKVRVLLDCILPLRGRSANNAFVALWMKKRNIDVRYLEHNRCQHAKVLAVDGVHTVVGSHNWTRNSLGRNAEASMYLTDSLVAKQFEDIYGRLFELARPYEVRQVAK